jgi:hypothetical protein
MSDKPGADDPTLTVTDRMVAEYLRRNPEFFNQHPKLLSEITLPHQTGQAVSLVERQVSLLRAQNEQHRVRLRELIEIARQNERLARRMHHLALKLMDAADPAAIFATLYDSLRKNFDAERVAVRLFAEPAFMDSAPGEEFVGPDSEGLALFKSIIDRGVPLAGKPKRQQQVFLFGDDADDVKTAVMVPLKGIGWGGVLAIGSASPERFREGLGVELLKNLGEALSLIVRPWVREKRAAS